VDFPLHGPFQSRSVYGWFAAADVIGEEKKTNKGKINQRLGGHLLLDADGHAYQIEIINVDSTPQPVGALFDHLLNEHGQFIQNIRLAGRVELGHPVGGDLNTIELLRCTRLRVG